MKTKNTLKNLIKMSTILLVFFSSSLGFSQNIVINTNTIWNASYMNSTPPSGGTWDAGSSTFTLDPSVNLEVNGGGIIFTIEGISVAFQNGTSLTLNAPDRLIVTTSAELLPADEWWIGIEATGNPSISQFDLGVANSIPEYYEWKASTPAYDPFQATVELLVNSKVIGAEIGINSIDGAIVMVEDAEFIDCMTAIKIANYVHPAHPNGTELNRRNASYVRNCNINVYNVQNYSSVQSDYTNYKQIILENVYGIHFAGVGLFNNDVVARDCSMLERGIGFYTRQATFTLHDGGLPIYDPITNCVSYPYPFGHLHSRFVFVLV